LLGDDRVAGVGAQLRGWHVRQHYRVVDGLGAGRHGVAETHVDLHVASGTVQQADQRDPDTGVVGFLADLLRVYRVRLEAYAVVQFHRTDVPKRRLDMPDLGRAEAQQTGVACRTMRDVEPQVEQQ